MQGNSENILTFLHRFQQKLLLWQNELRLGSLEIFPISYKNQKNVEKGFVLHLAKEHLTLIQQKYDKYFFAINTKQYMTGSKILSQLMLKYQRKNCPCVFEKISLK